MLNPNEAPEGYIAILADRVSAEGYNENCVCCAFRNIDCSDIHCVPDNRTDKTNVFFQVKGKEKQEQDTYTLFGYFHKLEELIYNLDEIRILTPKELKEEFIPLYVKEK